VQVLASMDVPTLKRGLFVQRKRMFLRDLLPIGSQMNLQQGIILLYLAKNRYNRRALRYSAYQKSQNKSNRNNKVGFSKRQLSAKSWIPETLIFIENEMVL
jgi:hypothetical protein